MLAAEALRLAAIEVLLPTAALLSEGPYPTLAKANVYDSRTAPVAALDQDSPYTPVLMLYTPESGVKLRGPHAQADDTEADAVLEIVAELSVSTTTDGPGGASEGNVEFTDALASGGGAVNDAEARLVLAALCSQVRFALERSQASGIWRKLVREIVNTEYKTFGVPEYGLRWHRVTIRMHCEIKDDDFDVVGGGLPEPINSLYAALPEQSYAKEKLAALATHFSPNPLTPLQQIRINTAGPLVSGPKDLSPD